MSSTKWSILIQDWREIIFIFLPAMFQPLHTFTLWHKNKAAIFTCMFFVRIPYIHTHCVCSQSGTFKKLLQGSCVAAAPMRDSGLFQHRGCMSHCCCSKVKQAWYGCYPTAQSLLRMPGAPHISTSSHFTVIACSFYSLPLCFHFFFIWPYSTTFIFFSMYYSYFFLFACLHPLSLVKTENFIF